MPQIDFSVRLLSGELVRFSLDGDPPISAFKERFEIEQNLSEFHEVTLYVGETELIGGNMSDVALLEGIEVQAVASASIEKALNVFRSIYVELCKCSRLEQHANLLGLYRLKGEKAKVEIAQTREKAARAASFLLQQFDDQVHDGVCDVILNIFVEWQHEHKTVANFSPFWQLIDDVMIIGCQLLGKYGNAIAADGLRNLIEELKLCNLYHDTNPMVVVALNAENKLKTQQGIQ